MNLRITTYILNLREPASVHLDSTLKECLSRKSIHHCVAILSHIQRPADWRNTERGCGGSHEQILQVIAPWASAGVRIPDHPARPCGGRGYD